MFKVSNSKVKTWRKCHNAYYYKYILKLRPKKKSAALVKGSIIHEMDDAWLNGEDWKQVLKKYQKQYDKLFKEEQEEYGDIINDMQTIMHNYMQFCKDDGLKPIEIDGRFSEHEGEVELIPNKLLLVFKIDKFVEDKQGRVWLGEKKSFKTNIPKEEVRFSDLQTTLYYWAAKELGLAEPTGVMWEYVSSKPPTVPQLLKGGCKLSQAKKIKSTYETYYNEIIKHGFDPEEYADILEDLRHRPNVFFRRIYKRSPEKIVKTLLGDLIQSSLEMEELGGISRTRNLTRDCSWCEYHSLCQAELWGLDHEFIMEREYEERSEEENGETKEIESSSE